MNEDKEGPILGGLTFPEIGAFAGEMANLRLHPGVMCIITRSVTNERSSMASDTRTRVLELNKQRVHPKEIAGLLGIKSTGVYRHLREAGVKPLGGTRPGNARRRPRGQQVKDRMPMQDVTGGVKGGTGEEHWPRADRMPPGAAIDAAVATLTPDNTTRENWWIARHFEVQGEIAQLQAEMLPLKALLVQIEQLAPSRLKLGVENPPINLGEVLWPAEANELVAGAVVA